MEGGSQGKYVERQREAELTEYQLSISELHRLSVVPCFCSVLVWITQRSHPLEAFINYSFLDVTEHFWRQTWWAQAWHHTTLCVIHLHPFSLPSPSWFVHFYLKLEKKQFRKLAHTEKKNRVTQISLQIQVIFSDEFKWNKIWENQ